MSDTTLFLVPSKTALGLFLHALTRLLECSVLPTEAKTWMQSGMKSAAVIPGTEGQG